MVLIGMVSLTLPLTPASYRRQLWAPRYIIAVNPPTAADPVPNVRLKTLFKTLAPAPANTSARVNVPARYQYDGKPIIFRSSF